MTQEQTTDIGQTGTLLLIGNATVYILSHYDQILGSILTVLSICYLSWKWYTEYKKNKKK